MNEPRATRYQRLRRRGRVAGVLSGLAGLALVALTPIAAVLHELAAAAGRGLPPAPHAALSLLLFVLLVVVVWELAAVPAILHSALRVGRRYGMQPSADAAEDVLAAHARGALVLLPVVVAAAAIVRWSIWTAGPWWWAAAGLMLAGASVLALRATPALVARLAGAAPLARPRLARRLTELAARAGAPVAAILEVPSGREPTTTAMVAGVGRSRRIFIASALTRDWSDDEIAVVVAHELGHCVHQDVWRTVAADAAVLCAALAAADAALASAAPLAGLPPVSSPAALPFLALVSGLVWIAATPLRHAQSRRHERRADAFALALTGSADAFDNAIRRLGAAHLAEERPGALARWLFHRHPSVGERLGYARTYRDLTGA